MKRLGVLLSEMPFMRFLRRPGLDEDEAVGIVGASEEIVGMQPGSARVAACTSGGAGEDRVSRPRLAAAG